MTQLIKNIGNYMPKIVISNGESNAEPAGSEPSGSTTANCTTKDISAGPLSGDSHAQTACPGICESAGGTWTAAWVTTIPMIESVCNCQICQ
jgi:hypothetical protein